MVEITLEKVDLVRERTGASYGDSKKALEVAEGNVVDAIIYIEENKKSAMEDIYTSKDEFVTWIKDIIEKGNVTRIVIKKDENIITNIPINAGIAVTGILAIVLPEILALGILTAVFANITIEITKKDGSVEVVNKIIKNTVGDVKDKFSDLSSDVKDKVSNITSDVKDKVSNITKDLKDKVSNNQSKNDSENIYKYTVKFEEIEEDK
jgi:hypothetical protein